MPPRAACPAVSRADLHGIGTPCAAEALEVSGGPGGVRKILVGLADGERVETVLIPKGGRHTVCLSTQAGCRQGCAFCAAGRGGFGRDLSAAEIVAQAVLAARLAGARPTNAVYMGVGEPLDNLPAVLESLRGLGDPAGLAVGVRKIALGTVGLVPGILRLAGETPCPELTVSLHAPTQALRERLLPAARCHPLGELMAACAAFSARTGRPVTFAYTLVAGLNDGPAEAEALAGLLTPATCMVNFLLLSPVPGFEGRPAPEETARRFMRTLAGRGIHATLRRPRGLEQSAACGQLRRSRSQALAPSSCP